MEKYNILVYPCSTGIGMEIYNSLKNVKNFFLFGLNADEKSKGYYLYNNYESFVHYSHPDFEKKIIDYIEKNNIKIIIPADDNSVIYFKKLEEKINILVITSPLETNIIARSKTKTYNKLKDVITVPKIYNFNDDINYPVYIKPDDGAGNVDSFKINNFEELQKYLKNNHIICEYLPGNEYTVECLTDSKNKLLCAIPRERTVISNGLSIGTKLILDDEILISKINQIAKNINDKLNFKGSWFFQIKFNSENELALLEISTRIPGASNILTNYGINMILMSIYIHLNKDVSILNHNFKELNTLKIYQNYYDINLKYENLYVDLDDTLIINDKINLDIISLIYKSINKNKKVYLITRHKYDLYETLKKHRISISLFDDIYWLKNNESKNTFIKNNSIFIDDSFGERKSVDTNKNVYCFDPANLDILINNKFI